MNSRYCFTETRIFADGSSRIVARETVPLFHADKAATVLRRMQSSLHESGLRGKVRVTLDGEDKAAVVENGQLRIIL